MTRKPIASLAAMLCSGALALGTLGLPRLTHAADPARALPPPALDPAPSPGLQTAIFAGGCFWGIQGVFEHVRGVHQATSGYAGGTVANPGYEQVSSGRTGHAESVRVTFDPAEVSYGALLQIFFSVALDPTQIDRQGPDTGTQYRSALFTAGPDQLRTARAYVAQLTAAHAFSRPIATQIQPAGAFYPAEPYHQDYLARHPDNPYIAVNDIPKVESLAAAFPQHWQAVPTTTGKLAAAD